MDYTSWLNAFAQSLETLRGEIFEIAFYDKQHNCFVFSSNPPTFAEIMESAENDAFEEYDDLPDWDTKDEKLNTLFHSEYLDKIKPVCEAWERHMLNAAADYDKHHMFDYDGASTATEYFSKYFAVFWGNRSVCS